jgi:hypothetical protein
MEIAEPEDSITPWPPSNYSEFDPVVLPLGPSSVRQRNELSKQPIFASPKDREAITKEESESILLFQLPSAIQRSPSHHNLPPSSPFVSLSLSLSTVSSREQHHNPIRSSWDQVLSPSPYL